MKKLIMGAGALVVLAGTLQAGSSSGPAELIVVGTDDGQVVVLDKARPDKVFATYRPFDARDRPFLAVGDLDGDGCDGVVVGSPRLGDGSVRFVRDSISLGPSFQPYDGYTGGVRVAVGAAYVERQRVPTVITAPGVGGGPHVKVFSAADGTELHSFFAYDPQFLGGVYVAAGDINGDGVPDIITGPGADTPADTRAGTGGGPHVKVFDGATGQLHASFFAYDQGFTGGVRVATGDVNGDGRDDIITGAGPGGGPHVKVFSANADGTVLTEMASFAAFDPQFRGGVFVAASDGSVAVTSDEPAGSVAAIRLFYAGAEVQWLMPLPSYKGGFTLAQSPGLLGKAPTRANIPGGVKVDETW